MSDVRKTSHVNISCKLIIIAQLPIRNSVTVSNLMIIFLIFSDLETTQILQYQHQPPKIYII